jgi:hypothetical protein
MPQQIRANVSGTLKIRQTAVMIDPRLSRSVMDWDFAASICELATFPPNFTTVVQCPNGNAYSTATVCHYAIETDAGRSEGDAMVIKNAPELRKHKVMLTALHSPLPRHL